MCSWFSYVKQRGKVRDLGQLTSLEMKNVWKSFSATYTALAKKNALLIHENG